VSLGKLCFTELLPGMTRGLRSWTKRRVMCASLGFSSRGNIFITSSRALGKSLPFTRSFSGQQTTSYETWPLNTGRPTYCTDDEVCIIQIVTGVEVVIENFWPKVRNMLPEIEDRGQHVTNWGEKINDDRDASLYLFCYTSTPLRKSYGILRSLRIK